MGRKEEMPEHIKEYFDRGKKIKKLLEATHNIHSQAYSKGLDVIKDKKGLPDHDKLEDTKIQDKMIDKMIDHYKTEALQKLTEFKGKGIEAPKKGTMEEDMFLKRYIGITRKELKDRFRKHKSNYTQKAHEEKRDELIEKQQKELGPLKLDHLRKKHIGDILEYTGAAEHLEADNIDDPGHVAILLDLYKGKGEVRLADLGQLGLPEAYLKKEAKQEMKELKKKHKQPAK